MPQIRDSGSNYQFYDKKINPKIKRSGFNLNRIRQTTADFGVLQPVLKQYAMPNSDLTFQHEMALTAVNPPAVPLGSRQRIFYHLYKVTFQQMWPKWGTFMSKGRNGNTVLPLPKIRFVITGQRLNASRDALGLSAPTGNVTYTQRMALVNKVLDHVGVFGPNCLSTFLQFPCPEDLKAEMLACVGASKLDFGAIGQKIYDYSAFPFFAYLSIWRNFYVNPNLDVNNEYLFPADENDFALVNSDGDDDIFYAGFIDFSMMSREPKSTAAATNLDFGYFKYRNFVDDYFTSSLPWPMRGDIPEVLIGEDQELTIPVTGLDEIRYVSSDQYSPFDLTLNGTEVGGASSDINYASVDIPVTAVNGFTLGYRESVKDAINNNLGILMTPYKATEVSGNSFASVRTTFEASGESAYAFSTSNPSLSTRFNFASSFTWEMIRNLSISTLIQEKMARTNGSYVEFVKTFFDQKPKNYSNNIPEYIGGDLQPILYRQVVQQSESGNTPLGTIGGKGMASSEGYLGKAHFDDFGLVLGLVSIMPDIYYSQGLHRIEMYEVQEDFPLPERAELGMQGVFYGEIFHTGDHAKDVDLFGYQNRYDEWRYAENELSGEVMNPGSYAYFPFTQSRYFLQKPELSKEFISSEDNIRRDYLSVVDEVPFFVQIANRIRVVQPLPYKAVPVGLK